MLHTECYTLDAVPMPRSDQLNFDPVKSKWKDAQLHVLVALLLTD
jgi:hypothetical protein